MNKQTKTWLAVGVVAVAAYYFWNKSKTAAAPAAPAAKFVGFAKTTSTGQDKH